MKVKLVRTNQEKKMAFSIRTTVFVDEQNVPPEDELDEHDAHALHFIGIYEGSPIAASRLRFINQYGKLERICVLKEYRGKSFGQQIIAEMEEEIRNQGYKQAKLNAQTHAEDFYKRLGYKTISNEFLDAGIPHVTMVKDL